MNSVFGALRWGAELLWVSLLLLFLSLCIPFVFFFLLLRSRIVKTVHPQSVGFFHPYCDAGGGGERVLFNAILHVPSRFRVVVFTGDEFNNNSILDHCQFNFGKKSTPPAHRITFCHLKTRFLVEATTWPRFTLVGQSVGSILLALEAQYRFSPEVFFDTMGYAFSYPFCSALGSTVACYVHYPTISTDMLEQVRDLKYMYYRAFALAYRFVGRFCSLILVNSTWTQQHMESLWGRNRSHLLFPPCTSSGEEKEEVVPMAEREFTVVSLAQFRPEKNHRLQFQVIRAFNQRNSTRRLKLVAIGSCRNAKDEEFVENLRRYAQFELKLVEGVDFVLEVNCPRNRVVHWLSSSLLGIHTMWNEHFGIGIVEMMEFGCIVVANNTGGPKTDIILPGITGFLASTVEEYVDAFERVLKSSREQQQEWRKQAKESTASRFSNEAFGKGFSRLTQSLFEYGRRE